jgi:hypothetical protein
LALVPKGNGECEARGNELSFSGSEREGLRDGGREIEADRAFALAGRGRGREITYA